MAFPQLSPSVNVTEVDLSTIVPNVSASVGALAGVFPWGPINQPILLSNENDLKNTFFTPTTLNPETFFTAASFLSYGAPLYVCRVANTTNATSTIGALSAYAAVGTASFYATITTTALSVTQVLTGTIAIGQSISGPGIPSGTTISSGSGTSWVLSQSSTVTGAILVTASPTITAANTIAATVLNSAQYNTIASFDPGINYVAKYPGALGNSLRISVCDSANAYSSNLTLVEVVGGVATANVGSFAIAIGSNAATLTFPGTPAGNSYLTLVLANVAIGDVFTVGNSSLGTQTLRVSAIGAAVSGAATINFYDTYRLSANLVANTTVNGSALSVPVQRKWEFSTVIGTPPATSYWGTNFGNSSAVDSLHVVVVDTGGQFTGIPNNVLEIFPNLSRATDAQTFDNASTYYKTVLNNNSKYVWFANDRTNAPSATSTLIASSTNYAPLNVTFVAGTDGYTESTVPLSTLATGYNFFADKQTFDVSLILQGKPTGGSTTVNSQTVTNFQLANYLIQNIAEIRKDCVVFVTPDQTIVSANPGNESTSLVNWAGAVTDSSYAVIDSGYKYTYDRYNDVYRYVPLNGDIAGLCARTDSTNDPWWSPAGFNRGRIKNVVQLRWNPNKAARDVIYSNRINPVISQQGQGTVLFGDKTATSKPSSFDRINVRRLFIVIEKAIAKAAQSSLFEFNDEFTRAEFKNMIIPYLRDVQARRGITDFLVVCDGTNNSAQIINSNQFVGDIYIKPNRSINFIQLNFVAVRTGVDFTTVVGQF
jgi:phage tail sheath protein FI